MADTKISALTAASAAAPANEFAINEAGTSKKLTGAQVRDMLTLLITGNSGAANANAAPSKTLQRLNSNAAANATTTFATVMTTTSVAAGTYRFRYDIVVQSSSATVSVKFRVGHSGTITRILARLLFPSGGVTAATGVMDQEINATTGNVYAIASTRVNDAALGPFTDVDTINADIHCTIEGLLTVSTSGSLTLGHASETATSTQVMADTMLELVRVA
jgi:hypothetical protein